MTTPEAGGAGPGPVSLQRLLETYTAWSGRDVLDQAARRAANACAVDRAAALRSLRDGGRSGSVGPSALEALAAQHELASLLDGWRWQTVAAREAGASWTEIGQATRRDPAEAHREYLAHLEGQAREGLISDTEVTRYRRAAESRPDDGHPDGGHSDGGHSDGGHEQTTKGADMPASDHEIDPTSHPSDGEATDRAHVGRGAGADGELGRDATGDRIEPDHRSSVAGDADPTDPPAEHPSRPADQALDEAQRRRLDTVQHRGFALTGPGHGAEAPEQRTLRERLRDTFTRFSKPAAAIDGERVAEVDVSDGRALAADPPPQPTEQVILDPDDVVVFDPVHGLRPLRTDETEMLRDVSSTEDYMSAWRAEQRATDTARADESAAERSPREVAEDMLEELDNAMAENAPASVPGYDDPAHDDPADDEMALADLWGGPRSDELIEQLGRHVQADPELAEDERFAIYLRALDEEPDVAVDGETIHGPTPPTTDELRDVHTDYSDAVGREDQPEVDRLRAEYNAVRAALDAAAEHDRGPEQGQRADVRLSEEMQRTVPTEFGPAQLGWVQAATEDELLAAGDDRDYSWNAHGQIDDREVAEMAAIDAELHRRASDTGDARPGDDQRSDDHVLEDYRRDEAALEGLDVAEPGNDPDTAARTHDREPQEPPSRSDLVAADRAILEHQQRAAQEDLSSEQVADEHAALHSRFYEVAEALPWHQRLGVRHAAERANREQQEEARRVELNAWHHADMCEGIPDDTGDADEAAGGDGWSR